MNVRIDEAGECDAVGGVEDFDVELLRERGGVDGADFFDVRVRDDDRGPAAWGGGVDVGVFDD